MNTNYNIHLLSITIKKEFINWSRYPLKVGSGMFFNVFIGVGLALGLSTLGPIGANYLIAYLVFGIYGTLAGGVTYFISSQATQGVLQRQLVTQASPLKIIISNRITASIFYSINIVLTIGTALVCGFDFQFDAPLTIFVLISSLPFFFGMGLLYAGLCLIFKRAENIIGSISLLELAFAMIAATNPPQFLVDIFRWIPYTQMVMLTSRSGVNGLALADAAGEFIPLLIPSVLVLLLGIYVFSLSDYATRLRGTMGQY